MAFQNNEKKHFKKYLSPSKRLRFFPLKEFLKNIRPILKRKKEKIFHIKNFFVLIFQGKVKKKTKQLKIFDSPKININLT